MTIVFLLVCVEVVILVPWLVYYQPDVKTICGYELDHNLLICKGIDDFSYIVGFIYPFFLVIFCTFYAIKTRKVSAWGVTPPKTDRNPLLVVVMGLCFVEKFSFFCGRGEFVSNQKVIRGRTPS